MIIVSKCMEQICGIAGISVAVGMTPVSKENTVAKCVDRCVYNLDFIGNEKQCHDDIEMRVKKLNGETEEQADDDEESLSTILAMIEMDRLDPESQLFEMEGIKEELLSFGDLHRKIETRIYKMKQKNQLGMILSCLMGNETQLEIYLNSFIVSVFDKTDSNVWIGYTRIKRNDNTMAILERCLAFLNNAKASNANEAMTSDGDIVQSLGIFVWHVFVFVLFLF